MSEGHQTTAEEFSIGAISCQVVPDGVATYRTTTFFGSAPAEELDPALAGQLNESGFLPVPYNGLLLRVGRSTALIDGGAGQEQAEEWEEPVGLLHPWLTGRGIAPYHVGYVIISHAHVDHIGGLTRNVEGRREPAFARARHLISIEEWDFWTSQEAMTRFEFLAQKARMHLSVLEEAGVLDKVQGEVEVVPGIRLLPTPGHTPGHLSVEIGSDGDRAVFLGDVVMHELFFEHPDWNSTLEVLPEVALETRRRVLEDVTRGGPVVVGPHLWRTGMLERVGGGYRFQPRG
jgi:glyoxylase-like metal-dependent hydrolase (beta-lactamase superfamily II)